MWKQTVHINADWLSLLWKIVETKSWPSLKSGKIRIKGRMSESRFINAFEFYSKTLFWQTKTYRKLHINAHQFTNGNQHIAQLRFCDHSISVQVVHPECPKSTTEYLIALTLFLYYWKWGCLTNSAFPFLFHVRGWTRRWSSPEKCQFQVTSSVDPE